MISMVLADLQIYRSTKSTYSLIYFDFTSLLWGITKTTLGRWISVVKAPPVNPRVSLWQQGHTEAG